MFSWLITDKKRNNSVSSKHNTESFKNRTIDKSTSYHKIFFSDELFKELKTEVKNRSIRLACKELDNLIDSLYSIPIPPPNPPVYVIKSFLTNDWDSEEDSEEDSESSESSEEYVSKGRRRLSTPLNNSSNKILESQQNKRHCIPNDDTISFEPFDWNTKVNELKFDDDFVFQNNQLFEDMENGLLAELNEIIVEEPVTIKDIEQISATIGDDWGEIEKKEGYLELNIGPMFSGKSSKLLFKLSCMADQRMKTLYINSSKDVRSTESQDDNVTTHNSCYSKLSDKIAQLKVTSLEDVDVSSYDYIGVDEFQFFENGAEAVKRWLNMGKYIIVASLDGDCYRRRFGTVLDLISYANEVTKLNAYCDICRDNYKILKKAPFTLRMTNDTSAELVGGVDMYRAACRTCHDFHLNETVNFETSFL